ncbi:MAG: hypothetical protein K2W33_12585 [Burkholderiales bacterium]|nr:hypothetical protein [Burkholderiales bacterium]
MPASVWSDPGAWIALGVSALFLVVGWAMHRVFVKVLKAPQPDVPTLVADFSVSHLSGSAKAEPSPTESKTP